MALPLLDSLGLDEPPQEVWYTEDQHVTQRTGGQLQPAEVSN
jgi:hypothetical protein